MPEKEQQGYYHQQATQGEDLAVGAVHHLHDCRLEGGVAGNGHAVSRGEFCIVHCFLYFQKELVSLLFG